MSEAKSYLRVKDVPGKYPAFTESSIRWAIFNKDTNGFNQVIRKVGRRVLIVESEFIKWIDSAAA